MTQPKKNNLLATLMQMVNENGLEAVAETFRILLNEAMKIERDQTLGAGLYERTDNDLQRTWLQQGKCPIKNCLVNIQRHRYHSAPCHVFVQH